MNSAVFNGGTDLRNMFFILGSWVIYVGSYTFLFTCVKKLLASLTVLKKLPMEGKHHKTWPSYKKNYLKDIN